MIFFIIPIKTAHSYAADENDPWTIFWIHFKGTVSNQIVSSIEKKTGLKGFILNTEKSIELFNEIYTQLERGYSSDNLMLANMRLWYFFNNISF